MVFTRASATNCDAAVIQDLIVGFLCGEGVRWFRVEGVRWFRVEGVRWFRVEGTPPCRVTRAGVSNYVWPRANFFPGSSWRARTLSRLVEGTD